MNEALPVVVVGGGPVGLVAAHLLGRRDVPTVVLERAPAQHALPRAAHLDDEALRVLQAIGLAGAVAPFLRPVRGMQLVTAADRPFWHFRDDAEPGPNGWPAASMMHQPAVDRALAAGLERLPSVSLRLGEEVEGLEADADGVTLTVRGAAGSGTLRAGWVLGCDGARSTLRRLLGVGVRDAGFEQRWLVVDTEVDGLLPDRPVQQVCDPSRPTTYVPMVGPRHRWEFLLRPHERPDDLLAERALAERVAPWTGGRPVRVVRAAEYRFHALRAERWRVGRAFLLGDAAHQMPPFLGQGLCAGLRDAANLTWKLALVRAGEAGDALLDTYERERAPHVALVSSLAVLAGTLIRARGPAAAALRGGLGAAARLPGPLRRPLEHVATPGLRRGPLVLPAPRPPGRRAAGHLLPQPPVRTGAGRIVLLDELLGDGFALVALDVDPLAPLTSPLRERWGRLGTAVLRVTPPGARAAPMPPAHAEDLTGALTAWFRRHGGCVAVVRPDRYVAALCEGRGAPGLAETLAALTGGVLRRPDGPTA